MNETKLKPVRQKCQCGLVVFLCVLMGFTYFFQADRAFQRDSDRFVNSMIAAAFIGVDVSQEKFGMCLLRSDDTVYDGIGGASEEESTLYLVYHSQEFDSSSIKVSSYRHQQIGLQGWTVYWLTRLLRIVNLPPRTCYHLLRAGNSMLLAIVLTAVSWELLRAYDALFAGIFFILSFFSSWLAKFSLSLYWVPFSWFLPMLCGLLCLNHPKRRFFLYPLVTLSVALKCACGYEYIPNIMLGAVLFAGAKMLNHVHFNKNKRTKEENTQAWRLFRTTSGLSVCCLAGFFLTFIIHGYILGNGSVLNGWRQIYENDILRRTYGNPADFDAVFSLSLSASPLTVLAKYLMMDNGIWAVLLTLSCIVLFRQSKSRCLPVKNDLTLLVVSFFSSISWFILAKAHSYIHVGVNNVLWYLPYLQTAAYLAVKRVLLLHDKDAPNAVMRVTECLIAGLEGYGRKVKQ